LPLKSARGIIVTASAS